MSAEEREIAADFYDTVAADTVGRKADLAQRYNWERARFLRGEVDHLAASAPKFAAEIGWDNV